MTTKYLVLSICIGCIAAILTGFVFLDIGNQKQFEFRNGSSLYIITDIINFDLGNNILIKIINNGTNSLSFSNDYGLKITGLDGHLIYSFHHINKTIEPLQEQIFVWDQTRNNGKLILEGRYKITITALDDTDAIVKHSVIINIHK